MHVAPLNAVQPGMVWHLHVIYYASFVSQLGEELEGELQITHI